MGKLLVTPLSINGAFLVETDTFEDHRGQFSRFYCVDELSDYGLNRKIVQINHSLTRKRGAIRGLHFQRPPKMETKYIRCLKGRVFDVLVDLRSDSETYLQWVSVELSEENRNMVVIPQGCAHGFQVLEENSELLYLHDEYYSVDSEDGVLYNDPALNINWPMPAEDISERDKKHAPIDQNFKGIVI